METIVKRSLEHFLDNDDGQLQKYIANENEVTPNPVQERQIIAELAKKFIREKTNDGAYGTLIQNIIIPVLIMMFSLCRQDTPLILKMIITVLVVMHIIFVSTQVISPRIGTV